MSALADEVRIRRRLPSRAVRRAIREEAGVSQARLAAELGVHPVTVARWELGSRKPSRRHEAAYLAVLDELKASAS